MKILNQTYDHVKEGQIASPTWNEIYSKTVRMRPRGKLLTQSSMGCMFVLIDVINTGKVFYYGKFKLEVKAGNHYLRTRHFFWLGTSLPKRRLIYNILRFLLLLFLSL